MPTLCPHLDRGLRIAAVVLVSILPIGCVGDSAPTAPTPSGSSPPPPSPAPGPTDAEVVSFIQLMNAHRVSLGMSALAWDPNVAAVATAHSQDMEDRDFFSHHESGRRKPGTV